MQRIKAGGWLLIFLIVFLLSQDYLFFSWPDGLSFGGFPPWLWWFVGVHLVLVAAFFLFSKFYWKTDNKKHNP